MSQIAPAPGLSFLEPPKLAPRGTLVVIPGRGERPEVYQRFGIRIAFDAYRVHVVDAPTVDERVTREQIAAVLRSAPGQVVLVGVDAAALFAARLAADEWAEELHGVILAGLPDPDQVADPGSWDEELDARTTCPTHRGRISGDLVTPGALYGPVPPAWFDSGVIARLDKPALAIHGQEDPISPLETARGAYAAGRRIELVSIAGARHDVLNDQSHRTTAATIVLWLERLRADGDLAPIASLEALTVNAA